jgi:hypothetical protein
MPGGPCWALAQQQHIFNYSSQGLETPGELETYRAATSGSASHEDGVGIGVGASDRVAVGEQSQPGWKFVRTQSSPIHHILRVGDDGEEASCVRAEIACGWETVSALSVRVGLAQKRSDLPCTQVYLRSMQTAKLQSAANPQSPPTVPATTPT